ncbi:MAG: spermidine/putrescine ABC transporter substrate-binding protein [Anaerolineales bacterium]|uniref:ABC transporter substrate-binding protein n=1 Tax=Candidatus Villigracilis vicinus TaxID=3140679 RepID=UPI00313735DF|nr:spermidine/putrescine ABC transporter substrate-binding protein [Anaerolineales bacterium]
MKNTRILLNLSLILVPILILTACGSASTPAPQAEAPASDSACPQPSPKVEVTSKELNMFTWSEYIPDDIINCFEEAYGVTVNHDTFASQSEQLAKLERGASGYDIVQPSDDMVQLMVEKDLFAELDKSQLSVMSNFNPAFLNPAFDPDNKFSLPYQGGSTGIVYNTETVKTPPTSYADLWNAEYAGHIIAVDDSRTMITITLLALGYDANSTDPAQLDEAKAKLKELTANIRIFDSDSPKTALISGEADLGIIWSTEAFTTVIEKPAFAYVYPSEGVILWQDNFAVMKDAPHADAAYAWLNYLNQADVFWMVMRDHSGSNPNAAAVEYAKANQPDVYAGYMQSNISSVPAEAVTNGHWLKSLTPENASIFDQLWTEVK